MSELERIWSTFLVVREAYAATLGIAAVCAYLGLFCVLRRIVFTGVALAQLAAAGVAGSFFVGQYGPPALSALAKAWGSTVGSLGMAVVGALGLEVQSQRGRVTSDAVVGLVYASATALAMLLVVGSSLGQSELQNILAGEVLLSREGELRGLWIGLAGVGLIHLLFRRDFVLVSFDREFARSLGLPERRLQLLLLGTLAVAVALALKVGGLLLVFTFLVLPPVIGLSVGEGLGRATLLALGSALSGSLLGFLLAIAADIPVAPSVTVTILALAVVARAARAVGPRGVRLYGLLIGLGSLLAPLVGVALALTPERQPTPVVADVAHDHEHDHDHDEHDHEPPLDEAHLMEAVRDLAEGDLATRLAAVDHLATLRTPRAVEPLIEALVDEEHDVRDAAAAALVALSKQPGAKQALQTLLGDDDPECRACAAFAYVHLQDSSGIGALIDSLADDDLPLLLKEQVLAHLVTLTDGDDFGFDPFGDDNAQAIAAWQAWWDRSHDRLHWDAEKKAFRLSERAPR